MVSPFEMSHQKVKSMIANPAQEAAVPALAGHLSLNHRITLEQCCGFIKSNSGLFPNYDLRIGSRFIEYRSRMLGESGSRP
jgi:hypothetical protein